MTEPTKADLKAAVAKLTTENAGLREEIAAHRTLLAAMCELATVPKPADWTSVPYICAIENRLITLSVYARSLDDVSPNIMVGVIRDRAKALREDAAKPARYELLAAPAPSGMQDPAPVARVTDDGQTYSDEPEPTLHQKRLQAVREGRPEVQDGPYAYIRQDA